MEISCEQISILGVVSPFQYNFLTVGAVLGTAFSTSVRTSLRFFVVLRVPWGSLGFLRVPLGSLGFLRVPWGSLGYLRVP